MLLVAACASSGPKTAEQYVTQYGGAAGVYRAILAESDCPALATMFETANANQTLGYMTAINDRMTAIDCG